MGQAAGGAVSGYLVSVALLLGGITLAINIHGTRRRSAVRCRARSHVGDRCDMRLGHETDYHFHRTYRDRFYEWQGDYFPASSVASRRSARKNTS